MTTSEGTKHSEAHDAAHRAQMEQLWRSLLPHRAVIKELAQQSSELRIPRGRKPTIMEQRQVAHRVMTVATDAVYGGAMDGVINPSVPVPERWTLLLPLLNMLMQAIKSGPQEFHPPMWLMSLVATASLLELKARFPDTSP